MYSYWPSLSLALHDEREPTHDGYADEENRAPKMRSQDCTAVVPTDTIAISPAVTAAAVGATQQTQESADCGKGKDKNRTSANCEGKDIRASVTCTLQWPDRASVEGFFKEPHTFRCNANVIWIENSEKCMYKWLYLKTELI
jgi:hypothetical protein